jgi:outer membrane protein assembly factor BamB
VRQVIGYDATTLGGWDVETGRRLWTLVPEEQGDFNVPTPVYGDGKLLVTTENNGTRLYAFDATGRIVPEPRARNDALAPDTQTPVVLGGRAFGCCGKLFCLDLARGLKTVWEAEGRWFQDYGALLAGNGRLLLLGMGSVDHCRPGLSGFRGGHDLKNSQIARVASKSRLAFPMMPSGRYSGRPGQACPPLPTT